MARETRSVLVLSLLLHKPPTTAGLACFTPKGWCRPPGPQGGEEGGELAGGRRELCPGHLSAAASC